MNLIFKKCLKTLQFILVLEFRAQFFQFHLGFILIKLLTAGINYISFYIVLIDITYQLLNMLKIKRDINQQDF